MKDKEKQIEELAKKLERYCTRTKCKAESCSKCRARYLIKQGYQKVDKDKIVLTKEELNQIQANFFVSGIEHGRNETAREILQRGKYCMPSGLREWIEKQYGVEVEE